MKQRMFSRNNLFRDGTRRASMAGALPWFIALQSAAFIAPETAEPSVIFSTLGQRELSVGDRVPFSVSTIVPKGATVVPPDPATGFGAMTVKEWNSRKHELSNADSIVFDYVLTTYKAENCTIPALTYIVENDTAHDSLRTVAAPLTVIPLCTADTLDIMDLKPQQVTGKVPLLWLWLVLIALASAAGIFIGRHFIITMRKPPPPPPPKPPYDEAIEAIAALEAKQYLIKGMVREYVFELSDILKRYIECRFGTNAAEFTTEEMLAWIGISPLDKSMRASMEWFFRAADPVKFAKYHPDQKSIDRFIIETRGFLEATRPHETVTGETADSTVNTPGEVPPAGGVSKTTGGAG
jgi:hypothetical protein